VTFDLGPTSEEPTDEELEPGRGQDRRLRVELLVGAAVLVAVLAAGKALSTRGDGPGTSASPTPSSSSSRDISIPGPIRAPTTPVVPAPRSVFITRDDGVRVLVPALPRRTFADPSACPVGVSCIIEEAVNGTVLDPVRALFPALKVVRMTTVRIVTNPWAGDLWYRELVFRSARAKLVVQISVPGAADSAGGGTGGDGMSYYGALRQQYIVYVEAFAKPAPRPDSLRRLASDDRLLLT
jgi:hypothetical protein